ncbi:MAG: mandelate racemase/muconate lactonizing enzyme family protein [Chloroflexota bacterium]|nr:mandelate racemase/muconate lactonizing enzyme family protein [Chloroflexota bacterium]
MKIEKIEIRYLEGKLEEPFAWSQRWTDIRSVINIKVITDEGIVGWGETFGSLETLQAISTVLKIAIGEDPRFIEKIWNKLYRATFQGHVFAKSAVYAISALDTALYDIVGKYENKSASDILGGRFKDSIPVYATGLYYTNNYSFDALIKEAEQHATNGYTGMKMKIGALSLKEDAMRVLEVKKTIGDDIKLMFDANEAYDPTNAIQFTKLLSNKEFEWFEEPCASRDDRSNKYVQENSYIPVSGGESLSTRWDFISRMVNRTFDIFQPDICAVGGPSEMHKVGLIAQSLGLKFNPHFWGTGISFAAALHSLSVQPLTQISMEDIPYENESVLECDKTPHPVRENLTNDIFIHNKSRVDVPNGPGLGIEVDEKALEKFTIGEVITINKSSSGQRIF